MRYVKSGETWRKLQRRTGFSLRGRQEGKGAVFAGSTWGGEEVFMEVLPKWQRSLWGNTSREGGYCSKKWAHDSPQRVLRSPNFMLPWRVSLLHDNRFPQPSSNLRQQSSLRRGRKGWLQPYWVTAVHFFAICPLHFFRESRDCSSHSLSENIFSYGIQRRIQCLPIGSCGLQFWPSLPPTHCSLCFSWSLRAVYFGAIPRKQF